MNKSWSADEIDKAAERAIRKAINQALAKPEKRRADRAQSAEMPMRRTRSAHGRNKARPRALPKACFMDRHKHDANILTDENIPTDESTAGTPTEEMFSEWYPERAPGPTPRPPPVRLPVPVGLPVPGTADGPHPGPPPGLDLPVPRTPPGPPPAEPPADRLPPPPPLMKNQTKTSSLSCSHQGQCEGK